MESLPELLASHFEHLFAPMRRTLAHHLHEMGTVFVTDVAQTDRLHIEGEVADPRSKRRRPYEVRLEAGDGLLLASCPCSGPPYCEHALALLLTFGSELQAMESEVPIPPAPGPRARAKSPRLRIVPDEPPPSWRDRLTTIDHRTGSPPDQHGARNAAPTPLSYVLEFDECRRTGALSLAVLEPAIVDGKEMLRSIAAQPPAHLAAADDHALQALYLAGRPSPSHMGTFTVPAKRTSLVLSLLAATGRLFGAATLRQAGPPMTQLRLDGGAPFRLVTHRQTRDTETQVLGHLQRGGERIESRDVRAIVHGTHALLSDRIVPIEVGPARELLRTLLQDGPLAAPADEADELLHAVLERTLDDPSVEPPVRTTCIAPSSTVLVVQMSQAQKQYVPAELHFDYRGRLVRVDDPPLLAPGDAADEWLVRDDAAEQRLLDTVETTHADRLERTGMPACYLLPRKRIFRELAALLAAGLRVFVDGKPIQPSNSFSVSVATGIDWFDVRGEIGFQGGGSLSLAQALLAARRGEEFVELGDGSTGALPQELLQRWAPLLALGEAKGDAVRMVRGQALLLDSLLAAQEPAGIATDEGFAALRERLAAFAGIAERREPPGFAGTLRDYQRLGLGWMHFLRELGLGGCLADDMGLGKTVQVLALLQEVHGAHDRRPTLLVVPRSLLDNWRREAERFTPGLRVLDFSGPGRWERGGASFDGFDLVLTTYGTLRSDAARLHEQGTTFEYAIYDEAQAIENAASLTAKAARLVQAAHRLALTGTPVQNHLGELWALFDLLSPGLLGRSKAFSELLGSGTDRRGKGIDLALLQRALAPFLLRRTKEQVLRELPPKQEQTLHCDLESGQRRVYDALREHYRDTLLNGPAVLDNKERFVVLEALLRLRQAACHPGLIDPLHLDRPAAKLDVLLPMLTEVTASGHKALVFSQFTSFLAIVKTRLDAIGVDYEYLDGRTRKRQERVDRFQQDPACSAFLISLKAGGFGLNLTAADYVFLLDPWWNPAAEAQAVDRAHRMGQRNKVVAYRLVARDTVEEKVLQLQTDKRALCDALLGDNASLLAGLRREDLAALLA